MWKIERPPPENKFRSTIFKNSVNLQKQKIEMKHKRHIDQIKNNQSKIFSWAQVIFLFIPAKF